MKTKKTDNWLFEPKIDENPPKTVKAFILYMAAPYKWKLALFFSLTFLGVFCWSASSYAVSQLIDNLSNTDKVESSAWILVGFFSFFRLFDEIFWRTAEHYIRSFKPQMVERIRTTYFKATLNKNHDYYVNSSSGRVAHWIAQTQSTADAIVNNTIWGTWGELLGLVLSAAFLFTVHWSLAVLFATWLILLFWYNNYRGKKYAKIIEVKSNEMSKAASLAVDSVANNASVRAFNSSRFEYKRMLEQQLRIVQAWRDEWSFSHVTNAVKGRSTAIVNIAAICAAVWLFSRGTIEIGGLALFLAYFNSASSGLWNLAWNFDEYYRQFGTLQNALDGLVGEDERIGESIQSNQLQQHAMVILDRVSFSYVENKKAAVLDDFSLEINQGEKIGLVGHSGAGKSTLVALLLGFYEPTSGQILINDIAVSSKDPSYMREMTAYVPQDTSLFNRTIRENVIYARPDATEEDLVLALKKAEAYDFVTKLPNGVDTLVGERGVKLSGGQRQRLAIARAILRGAPFLILDEATSALDSVSEQAIQRALHTVMEGRTALVVAHRLSTLKHLDRIIVMEHGKIKESGSHDELLNIKGGIYADLWKRQKDGFIVE
jgi:ATP-binding cassette, subfamily B, bacterial